VFDDQAVAQNGHIRLGISLAGKRIFWRTEAGVICKARPLDKVSWFRVRR
jgi:hypothetical protein